ncbi:MAG: hypothetical protein HZB26_10315 [Candidatus Hydrogenedentes bacterium]|nr:hypothetical protein [Candidatus Hydrogenedentota bacterium]
MRSQRVPLLCLFVLAAVLGASSGYGQTSYQLGLESPLLDSAFYAGEASDGSNVSGRQAFFGRPSNSGTTVAFWAANNATFQCAIFLVDVGQPSSWRRLTADIAGSPSAPIYWTPDDQYLFAGHYRIPIATGTLVDFSIQGYQLNDASMTRLPSGNWAATLNSGGTGDVVLLPILPSGDEDVSRSLVIVTNIEGAGIGPDWPHISGDGTQLTFADYDGFASGTPDHGDVWVVKNLQAIINAPKLPGTDISSLAPTTTSDPNMVAIRTTESANFAHTPFFSQDGSLVFYCEDFNNVFENNNFFATVAVADFDVMISKSDGSGSDIRLTASGNQFAPIPFPGGTRLLYLRDVAPGRLNMFVTTLEMSGPISGTVVGADQAGTGTNDGINDIVTTTEQTVSDASGTVLTLPAGTVVDFPTGAAQEITVITPIGPATQAQLPPGVNGIPVVRQFGPDGARFWPPIVVTIAYTDQEIAGMDEAHLRVFCYNSSTGVFDIEIPESDIVSRDLANNRISFRVTHFSTFGLGGATLSAAGLLALILTGYGITRVARRRTKAA